MIEPFDFLPERVPWEDALAGQRYNYVLQGYVRTDVPGYREIQIGSRLGRAASGTHLFADWMDAMSVAAGAAAGAIYDESTTGQLTFDVGTPLTFPDRAGWLLGAGVEAGTTMASAVSLYVPPGRIPLMGAVWDEVELEREVKLAVDTIKRQSGYVWGAARIWRVRLTMHRWSLDALRTGWCRAGRCRITPYDTTLGADSITLLASGVPNGCLDGRIVAQDAARWLDKTRRIAEVAMLFATTAT